MMGHSLFGILKIPKSISMCSGVGISQAHFRIGEGSYVGTKTD